MPRLYIRLQPPLLFLRGVLYKDTRLLHEVSSKAGGDKNDLVYQLIVVAAFEYVYF